MATNLDQEVADLVLREMGRAEMSKAALALKSGIPLTTLRRKLDAHVGFHFDELYRVAGSLGVLPSAFTPVAFNPVAHKVAI